MFINMNMNPKQNKTGDCTTRALALAMGISWEDAFTAQFEEAKKHCLGFTDKAVIDAILTAEGFAKMSVKPKKGGKRFTPESLGKQFPDAAIVANVAGHTTCIMQGDVCDIWDCSRKGVYVAWIKHLPQNSVMKQFCFD